MIAINCRVCDPSGHGLKGSEKEPCGRAFDGPFEVLGEASVSPEPGECALDDPAARQDFEGVFGGGGSLDDSERPIALPVQGCLELLPCIGAVGEDVSQPGEAGADGGSPLRTPIRETSRGQPRWASPPSSSSNDDVARGEASQSRPGCPFAGEGVTSIRLFWSRQRQGRLRRSPSSGRRQLEEEA
jgi:hypothetical protein